MNTLEYREEYDNHSRKIVSGLEKFQVKILYKYFPSLGDFFLFSPSFLKLLELFLFTWVDTERKLRLL